MTAFDIARRWIVLVLAETLTMSAAAIEAILPFQPRWLAQIGLLAAQLHAAAQAGSEVADSDENDDIAHVPNLERLLASHARLSQGMADIVARGLALDGGLLDRMRKDWNIESVVSYLCTAEANLREQAVKALDEAAAKLGTSATEMTGRSDLAAKPKAPEMRQRAARARPPVKSRGVAR